MDANTQAFLFGQTAVAAYATLLDTSGESNVPRYVDQSVGMTPTQATLFESDWQVLQQSPEIWDGFSAVLFQNRDTGQKVLAIAGSNSTFDYFTDAINIGYYGSVLGMPQYGTLQGFYTDLLASGKLAAGEQFIVTGHSLGGFLAQAFTARHSEVVSAAYTYNAPGFGSLELMLGFLGFTNLPAANAKIVNIHAADGISFTAGRGYMLGSEVPVRIESQFDPLENHRIVHLADALSVYSLYAQLQPSISPDQAVSLFRGSGQGSRTLEDALDALRTVFVGPSSNDSNKTPTGDREAFYGNFATLVSGTGPASFESLKGSVQLLSVGSNLVSAALRSDDAALAYRYALLELLPIAVVGNSAAGNQLLYGLYADRLALVDWAAGTGSLTQQYLRDRAEMLDWLILRNTKDLQGVITAAAAGKPIGEAVNYHDLASGTQILVGAADTNNQRKQVIFGDGNSNELTGFGKEDHLYGGSGNDKLMGLGGNDWLDGGEGDDALDGGAGTDVLYGGRGTDKYDLTSGELGDIIRDLDGQGTIWVDGVRLEGGTKQSSNVWTGGGWTYLVTTTGDLVISKDGTNDRVIVRDWQSKDQKLGIVLQETPANPPPPPPPPGSSVIGTNDAEVLTGTSASELIQGLEGNDIIDARAGGDNILDGGGGSDMVMGGDGLDTIMGGAGRDVLFAYGGDDEVWGGNKSDFDAINNRLDAAPDDEADLMAGGWNDDRLYGGAGNDAMFGGGNGDFIVAGSGDDNVLADYYADETYISWQLVRQTVTQPDGGRSYVLTFVNTGYELALEPGNDVVFAGAGADWVTTGAADDFVDGGPGGDIVWGMAGDDVIDGGDENDHLHGDGTYSSATALDFTPLDQHGNDILYGGRGNDTLSGQGGNDYLDGEENDDTLAGGSGDDDLLGGDGGDSLDGDEYDLEGQLHGEDYLDGEDGNDTLVGNGGGDNLFGGFGDDQLAGDDDAIRLDGQFHGADYLDGEAGADTLWGGGGDDTLFGAIGHDHLLGDDGPSLDGQYHGADYLNGEDGNDTLVGGGSDDTLYGGVDNDLLLGDASDLGGQVHGADHMDGEDGDDTLIGGGGNDTMFGGVGNDSMYGDSDELPEAEHGSDYLDGEDGNDSLSGQGGNDTLLGGAGLDTLFGVAGDDLLTGGADNDALIGGEGADTLFGDAGDDALWGDAGQDYLDGGDGNDQLAGGDGDDLLDGGGADDTLVGGIGSDTLQGSEGNDWLQGEQDDDLIEGGAGNDIVLAGTGNDTLLGREEDDWLQGDAGNDLLDGGAGHDTLRGGDGDDTLVGSASDVLVGGAGNDTYVVDLSSPHSMATDYIEDTAGSNHIRFSGVTTAQLSLTPTTVQGFLQLTTPSGTIGISNLMTDFGTVQVGDGTYGSAQFFGATYAWEVTQSESIAGAALQGGKVGDTLTSTGGGATLAGGLGNDTLTASGGNNSYLYFIGDGEDTIDDTSAAAQRGTVVLGAGLTPDELKLAVGSGTLLISFAESTPGALRISGFTAANAAATPGVARYRFSDGSELTHQQMVERGFDITGTAGNDTVTGTNLTDRVSGGKGDDTLVGTAGADTYNFNRGDGSDLVSDGDAAAGSGDKLRFGEGITPEEVRALRNASDVTLVLGSDQVTLKSYFGGGADAVEEILFADGTQWTEQDVLAAVAAGESQDWVIVGDESNNLLRGLGANDSLDGRGGADTLYGATGNDTLIGGSGSDTLYGQAGSDTYVVAPGGERDTIDERNGGEPQGVDVLRFEQVSRADVSITASGNDVAFYYAGSGSVPWLQAVVSGQFESDSASNQVERFEFADGTVLTPADLKAFLLRSSAANDWIQGFGTADSIAGGLGRDNLIGAGGDDSLYGEQGDDALYGEQGNDALHGGSGDDMLYGSDGDDTLAGGTGWDRLEGGAGSDTYFFGTGDGMDIVVSDSDGMDGVRLTGVGAANVMLHRVSSPPAANISYRGDSLVIQLNGGSDQLWIPNYFDPATQGYIENLVLDDGTSWDYAAVTSRLVAPAQGGSVNSQTGTTKANTFTIDHWNDVITDPAYGDADKVTASVSYRLPANVNDLALTGSLNLFAQGSSDSDILRGNAGSNRYDFLEGGGYDTLAGGKGDDVYVVRSSREDWEPGADATWMGGATISELAGEGVDTLSSGFWSARLPANVENLIMTSQNPRGTIWYDPDGFNDFTHRFIGNSADNVIDASLYEAYAGIYTGFSTMGDYRLDGGAGADTLIGGRWNDTYVIDQPGDVAQETMGGSDTVETPFGTSLLTEFANIENVTLVGSAAVSATGTAGDNKLSGALNTAANRLEGGLGNDTYTVGAGDTAIELVDQGTDLVIVASATGATVRLEDFPNVENLRLESGSSVLHALGTGEANSLTGNSAANHLEGLAGSDTVSDQYPEDFTFYSVVSPEADNDTLEGGEGDDILYSYGGIDVMHGGPGDDQLTVAYSGRTAVVKLGLGDGHDALSTQAAAAVTVEFGSGILPRDVQLQQQADSLVVALSDGSSVTLANSNLLSLRFADGTMIESGQVSIMLLSDDRTTATSGGDVLFGTDGLDTISGLAGDDAVFAGDGDDVILGGDGNDTLYGGNGLDLVEGGLGDDRLLGGAEADTLVGGGGSDVLAAGAGADVYRFSRGSGQDSADDTFNGSASPAADDGALDVVEIDAGVLSTDVAVYRQVNGTTVSALVLAITNTADRLSLEHAYASNGVGAIELVRFANGTEWDLPTLKGKIAGEVGYDGNDTLVAPITSSRLEGRGGNDSMTGSSGADTLDGGTGNDTMTGMAGNDTYWVDSLSDVVVEASRGGTDTVIIIVDNYVMAAEVETLQMAAGPSPLRATGNALNNTMLGNAGNNRLDGGAGSDSMSGGAGDDVYVVNATGDTANELADEGMDTIESSITWTLGLNVENLTLTGLSATNGTGNALDNVLIGNSAKNVLNGGAGNDRLNGGVGADAMTGGVGDDVYVVDDALDTTAEAASGGIDTVESSITWTLAAEVEQLLLTGTSATNGTGNALDNRITGNAQANTLTGNAGNDTLDGAGGNDTLVGGGAADTFVFGAGSGTDTISDFSVTEGDRVQIASAVNGSAIVDAATALAAAHASGANVAIDLGGGNSITLIGVTLTELTTAQFVVG